MNLLLKYRSCDKQTRYPKTILRTRGVPHWAGANHRQHRFWMIDHGDDNPLFAKLKDLRTRLATAEHVPPYVVFSDATLRDMVEKRPITLAQFLSVSGVGEHKQRKYGNPFIKLIQEHLGVQAVVAPESVYTDGMPELRKLE